MRNDLKKENAVAIVVNQAFAHYARPLINSIHRNWPDHPVILLFLSADVLDEQVAWFSGLPKVVVKRFNPIDYEYRRLLQDKGGRFDSKAFNDAGFFIMNFWSEMFSDYHNILILDADMLVLKNLNELIQEESFLAVSAANERILPVFSFDQPLFHKARNLAGAYLRAVSMGIVLLPYVSMNSGVIKIGPQDRTPEKYKALLNILKYFRTSCIGDQEIILMWMNKFSKQISKDFRMNFQARFFNGMQNGSLPKRYMDEIKAASEDIHILHFNGVKPDSPHFLGHPWTKGRNELVDLYNSYL